MCGVSVGGMRVLSKEEGVWVSVGGVSVQCVGWVYVCGI